MPEEKHDAGFKVVDRRSFATETGSPRDTAETPPQPAGQTAALEPPRIEDPGRPVVADGSGARSRIELPESETDFGLEVENDAQRYSGFETVVSYLGTTAMFQLGLMAGPTGDRIPADLANARQTIDMLEVLQEKTRGNLNGDEIRLLDDILYELRMAYVEVEKRTRPR